MNRHENCPDCKCEPQYVKDEFQMAGVQEKDLPTFVGIVLADYVRKFADGGKNPYKLDFQLRFEYDPRYLRDQMVIVRKNFL